ncbi:hypothetical protein [Lacticaseibacillus kribbianus]|uniref:hypothetical protein n=1 Tax=Lacticaseibacillus kribbianus TaxID=2926292 RepID=UPI001CD1E383|nr:hypothetical protein [Lacticaseibacillus kribbianus]
MKKSTILVNGKPVSGLAAIPVIILAVLIAAVVLAVVVPIALGVSALALGAALVALAVAVVVLIGVLAYLPFARLRRATIAFQQDGARVRYTVQLSVRLRDAWPVAKGYYRQARAERGRIDAFAAAVERYVNQDLHPVFEQALAAQYGEAVAEAFVAAGTDYQVNELSAN